MKKVKSTLNKVIGITALILSLMPLAAGLSSCSRDADEKEAVKEVPASLQLYQELKSVNKIVFASMSVTKSVKMESDAWYKIGKRIAVYSYDSHLRAYIDMSALKESDLVFNDADSTVVVNLPPITTEVAGRDMTMRKEYENIGFFRSELDSKERAEMKERANDSFVKEVENNATFKKQLTEAARQKARKFFESLCESAGYTATINFR